MRAGTGLALIVFGAVAAIERNVDYMSGDVRGTDAFHWIAGGIFIALGIWLLLSIHYLRLRGPWR